jgi:hypothetical protein
MSMQPAVRLATPSDQSALLEHLRLHHAENGVYGVAQEYFPLDDEESLGMMARAWNRQGAIIGVIEEGGALQASICLLISKLWHTKRFHLDELWTFVHPECRRSKHAHNLAAFAKKCAIELKLPLVSGIITNERTESKLRFYKRNYGYPVGAFFVFNGEDERSKPNGELVFWDNPFPRAGVSVVCTHGLSKESQLQLERMKSTRRKHESTDG